MTRRRITIGLTYAADLVDDADGQRVVFVDYRDRPLLALGLVDVRELLEVMEREFGGPR